MQKEILGHFNLTDPYGNAQMLKVYEKEDGYLNYRLSSRNQACSLSNLQVGWRGPELPVSIDDALTVHDLVKEIKRAVQGGTNLVYDDFIWSRKSKYYQK